MSACCFCVTRGYALLCYQLIVAAMVWVSCSVSHDETILGALRAQDIWCLWVWGAKALNGGLPSCFFSGTESLGQLFGGMFMNRVSCVFETVGNVTLSF